VVIDPVQPTSCTLTLVQDVGSFIGINIDTLTPHPQTFEVMQNPTQCTFPSPSVESSFIHLKLSSHFSIRRVFHACFLDLLRKHYPFVFVLLPQLNTYDTLNSKPCFRQAVHIARPNFFCTRPSDQPYVQNWHKQEFLGGPRLLLSAKFFLATTQAVWFLQVLPRSLFKRLMLSTTFWQHAKLSTILKGPKGLKDLECKKGQLSSWPPIPYVPPTDLITTKEAPESLKIKLPNGTVFNMSIFAQGNTEEYLAHIAVVLRLINQTGLDVQCKMLAKTVDRVA
jgi:hypothetical protein